MPEGIHRFTSIKNKFTKLIFLLVAFIFLLVSSVLGLYNFSAFRVNYQKIEQNLNDALIDKGYLLVNNNSQALVRLVEENAFSNIAELVKITVHEDNDIVYGIYMDNIRQPWTLVYSDSNRTVPNDLEQLNDSLSIWAQVQKIPAHKKINDETMIEFAAPILSEGEKLGSIRYGLSLQTINDRISLEKALAIEKLVVMSSIMVGLMLLVGVIAYFFGSRYTEKLISPMIMLANHAKNIESGDYSVKIERRTNDEVGVLARSLEQMRIKVKEYTEQLGELVNEKTRQLESSLDDLSNLMNNVGQGFLSFDASLKIDKEYSQECVNMFGQEIGGLEINKLLCPHNEEEADHLADVIMSGFYEKNEFRKEMFLTLLPTEVWVGDKVLQIESKFFYKDKENRTIAKCMMILTDISEKKELEQKVQQESQTLKLILRLISNKELFQDSISEYNLFVQKEATEILTSNLPLRTTIFEIFREVHTLKGLFSQLEMAGVYENLHHLEDELTELLERYDKGDTISTEEILEVINVNDMREWLNRELNRLKEVTGNGFELLETGYWIEEKRIEDLKDYIINVLPPYECQKIITEVQKITYQPLINMLKDIPKFIMDISERQEKLIHPVIIKCEEIYVDHDYMRPIISALLHVFRNTITHGIETIDERINKGKDEMGKIHIQIRELKNSIQFIINDDGQGIDVEKIKKKLIVENLIEKESVDFLDDFEVVNMIFNEGFSLNDEVDLHSGRGVGLSAVKKEVEYYKGTISVSSILNEGTTFVVKIPKKLKNDRQDIKIEEIYGPYFNTILKHFTNVECLKMLFGSTSYPNKIEEVHPHGKTAFIEVKGHSKMFFGLGLDDHVLVEILKEYDIDDELRKNMNKYELSKLKADLLVELNNICIGNTMEKYHEMGYILNLGEVFILEKNSSFKFDNSEIYAKVLETNHGMISCYVIKCS